jgi:hypothetical protein
MELLVAQNDDPELLEWLTNAANRAGSFLQNLAWSGLRADHENYPILRPVAARNAKEVHGVRAERQR